MTLQRLSLASRARGRPARHALIAVGLTLGLAACGGGGSGSNPAGGLVGGGTAMAGPMSFSVSAPALGAAPAQLPRQGSNNVCQDFRFGGRDIENLQVPDGARCVLEAGVHVDGNVELGNASEFYATGVTIDGNLQGQGAGAVLLEASTVGGNVQLDIGRHITVRDSTVGGSIQLVENGGAIHVLSNVVDSDVQLFQNVGGARVGDNRVDGNLQCKENRPAPEGSGNVVQGNKEDQCAAL